MNAPELTDRDDRLIIDLLGDYFDPACVSFKPLTRPGQGGKCQVVAYVDARDVIERLNAVLGWRWQDTYTVLPNHSVQCTLAIEFGGQWIARTDVGSESEQPDAGDKIKAAHSDALKRAAVKWGIGMYLYRLPRMYAEWDQQARKLKTRPALPTWAIPEMCRDAGGRLAEEVVKLAVAACDKTGTPMAKAIGRALDKYGYKEGHDLACVQKRHALKMKTDFAEWIAAIAREPVKAGAGKPA